MQIPVYRGASRGRLSPVHVPAAVELGVQAGAVRLRNSVVTASGTFAYGLELAPLINLNRLGGLSGPAINPSTLRQVLALRKAVRISIMRLGGIQTAEDVLECLVVGATAVQVGTASFADPTATERIASELEGLCAAFKIFNINELSGKVVRKTT